MKQLLRPFKPAIVELALATNRHFPIPIRKSIFNYHNSCWESFFVPSDYSWIETLSQRIRDCLQHYPDLSQQHKAQLRNQKLPLGFVLSTGRAGTRALSLFLNSAPGIASLHRLADINGFQQKGVEDKRERNTIIYSFMMKKYSLEWLREQILYALNLSKQAIEYSNRHNVEFWYSAHRWNCYYPLIRVLFPQHKLIYLTRDPYRTIYSMVSKDQYTRSGEQPDLESTWTNFEPMDRQNVQDELDLRLTHAPLFDRITWYIAFVEYLNKAFSVNFTGVSYCEFSIDEASVGSRDAYERLKKTANLSGVDNEQFKRFFGSKVNVKNLKISHAFRFPEVENWDNKLISRYEEMSRSFAVVSN